MVAKCILPWFGGGPSVWTTCMLFFQGFLLVGYAYAHLLGRLKSVRVQVITHAFLLLACLAFLPVAPGSKWKPMPGAEPVSSILFLLTACAGLPFAVLAATGPLLQQWLTRIYNGTAPYRFYALSNAASLLALLSYPFYFEPRFNRMEQSRFWAWGFGVFAIACGLCIFQFWRTRGKVDVIIQSQARVTPQVAPAWRTRSLWFLLSACGSILLLATTNKLCLDVAAVPFLWMLPLSIYLLSFIITFDKPAWYSRNIFSGLLAASLALLAYTLSCGTLATMTLQLVAFSLSLFSGCVICHGEMYRNRPAPEFLGGFYLMIAAGGAAGGFFVAVICPMIFGSYAEFYWGYWALVMFVAGCYFRGIKQIQFGELKIPAWPLPFTAALACSAGLWYFGTRSLGETVSSNRNFYGVLRVSDAGAAAPFTAYKLNHGSTTHGLQFTDPGLSMLPTTYYNESSGIGVVLNNFSRESGRRIGVVGLGTGTLAAYGREGDVFRFYEIDPAVRKVAQTRFTYLRQSKAKIEVVEGDARLRLESEAPQQFDVLALDAFSSDAIPIHLLTEEAFKEYFRHLAPGGVLAVHISNRHLNFLRPLVGAAKEFHQLLLCIAWNDPHRPWWFSDSNWVFISRNQKLLTSPQIMSHATIMPVEYGEHPLLWTDDHASLASILKR
jgi:SAM-dependent methyltransferase